MTTELAQKLLISFMFSLPILFPFYLATIRGHRFTAVIAAMSIYAMIGFIIDNAWIGSRWDIISSIVWIVAFFLAFTPNTSPRA